MDILDEAEHSHTYERRIFLFKRFLKITISFLILSVIFLSFFHHSWVKKAKQNMIVGDLLLQYFQDRKQKINEEILQKAEAGAKDIALMLVKEGSDGNFEDKEQSRHLGVTESFLKIKYAILTKQVLKSEDEVLCGNAYLVNALYFVCQKDKDNAMKVLTKAAGNSFSDMVKIEAKMLIANLEEF